MAVAVTAVWIGSSLVLALAVVWGLVARRRALSRLADVIDRLGGARAPYDSIGDSLDRIDALLDRQQADQLDPRRYDARLRAALDAVTTGVVIGDLDGSIVFRNAYAVPFDRARHGHALVEAAVRARMQSALAGETGDQELELYGPPHRIVYIHSAPLELDGERVGAVVLIDDVSEHHRLDAVRRDFVANLSHELKTPVGGLSLLAETLTSTDDPEVQHRLAERIQTEAFRVNSIIDDLLDLSRIEAVGAGLDTRPMLVAGVVREAVGRVAELARSRDIRVEVGEIEPDLELVGEERQIVSCLQHLLENAVQYSDRGGPVRLRVAVHGDELAIAVEDRGVGIPAGDVDRIFERFYRVDRARSRETGGTGLGLSIVRHVALNHGGSVAVASREGEGSTFTLILPLGTGTTRRELEVTSDD